MTNRIDSSLERTTDAFIDNHYRNGNDLVPCCICNEIYLENDLRWFIPHICGDYMDRDAAYVCSDSCSKVWVDKHYEEIAELTQAGE